MRWVPFGVAAALVACGSSAVASPQEPPASDVAVAPRGDRLPDPGLVMAMRRARVAVELGRKDEALKLIEEALSAHPGHPEPFFELLALHHRLGGTETALAGVRERLRPILANGEHEVAPETIEALLRDRSAGEGDLALVGAYLEGRLAARPGDLFVRRFLVRLGLLRGDFAAAFAQCEPLLAGPQGAAWKAPCGLIALQCGEHVRAAALLGEATKADPDDATLASARMEALARGADPVLLAGILEQMPAPSPAVKDRLHRLVPPAVALGDAGRPEDARRLLLALARHDPDGPAGELAAELFGTHEDRAAAAARRREALRAIDPRALQVRAAALLDTDPERACEMMQIAAEGLPKDARAWFNFGAAALRARRWSDAERAYDTVLVLDAGWIEALEGRTDARIRGGRYAEALPDLERIKQVRPDTRRTWGLWVEYYRGIGDIAAGQIAYKKYREAMR